MAITDVLPRPVGRSRARGTLPSRNSLSSRRCHGNGSNPNASASSSMALSADKKALADLTTSSAPGLGARARGTLQARTLFPDSRVTTRQLRATLTVAGNFLPVDIPKFNEAAARGPRKTGAKSPVITRRTLQSSLERRAVRPRIRANAACEPPIAFVAARAPARDGTRCVAPEGRLLPYPALDGSLADEPSR